LERLSTYAALLARILLSIVFVLNALGIIDQTIPAREMAIRGIPVGLVPGLMFARRSLELIAGVAPGLGLFPRQAVHLTNCPPTR
jgi:uncharacterized membrane protein YphA (DoxX/SURF4 family)